MTRNSHFEKANSSSHLGVWNQSLCQTFATVPVVLFLELKDQKKTALHILSVATDVYVGLCICTGESCHA